MTDKTHWKSLVNPDYIGAYALPNGDDLTVTIKSVGRQMVTSNGGREEECTVAQLDGGHKPFIINATNSKSIQRLYGPYIEDWAGKRITLFASTTSLKGEMVECLRIRPKVSQPTKKTITDDRLKAAIGKIQDGEYTREKLLNQFALSDSQLETLDEKLEVRNVED